ncbi:hypothetical protein ABZ958_26190 [Streptomyces sp. NPDC046237]|uniref:hypothetical protein n=1 Tax=Streptomyces sp. NPDC046237 TaxID=3154914 RepID=UPI003403295A
MLEDFRQARGATFHGGEEDRDGTGGEAARAEMVVDLDRPVEVLGSLVDSSDKQSAVLPRPKISHDFRGPRRPASEESRSVTP